ncbi:DNA adenine methylase [Helicobacter ailurogastricus]|uniref:DNA adenine methylase n=1 Tax=Helicobacter ailurogastricus TaxID=1578720 RepID=UPI0022C69442|nr:DNA adenine methylase [Helicobacter ailurogastricus]GLH58226.1 Site-specific DNA-methyltransferase [Helicobacter ailurogastricus]GLH59841.1 Site-specific DNA-methyltransferase [Helicobacter ailurogastricus]
MNYIGSKQKLLGFLFASVQESLKARGVNLAECVFTDLFSGTAAVGRFFKGHVKQVLSNDKEFYSFVLAKHYIENTKPLKRAQMLVDKLNNLPPLAGKIYKHYALGGGEGRLYFSDTNALKIDAMRTQIQEWQSLGKISQAEYYFLLTSLLEVADKVANTACVYGAFLKKLKKSAQQDLILTPASLVPSHNTHHAYHTDAKEIITRLKTDILYLDPPYNQREYGANYHLLNSIALYDNFTPKGKTGLRRYEKSAWCKKSLAYQNLEYVLKHTTARFIFLSYNNEGLLRLEEVKTLFSQYGHYERLSQTHPRFSNSPNTKKHTIEHLHVLCKG